MKTRVIQVILLASILTWVWGSAAWAADRSRERSQQRIQKHTRSVERGGREQARASRHIYRAMHNNATRYRHHGHYRWDRHATRYHGHLKRHHYLHHRKGRPHPVVYNDHNPYRTQSYYADGYAFSGSINEPGWTLGFSTVGHW